MHSHYQIDPLLFQVSQQWNGAQKVDSVSNLVLITLKEFGVPFPHWFFFGMQHRERVLITLMEHDCRPHP